MATSRTEAYNFAPNNTLESIEFLCNFWREQGAEPIDERGNTVLHFPAIYGNVDAFTKLIRHGLVNSDQLKKQNDMGNTALHEAARFGQKDGAEIMLRNERDLVSLRNNLGETPLYIAAAYGKREVFTLLENFNSDYMMSRHDGCTVLHALVLGRYYYLALTTMESYPDLAHKHKENGVTALHLLAKTPSSFRCGSSDVLRNLGTRPFLPLHILEVMVYVCIPAIYVESRSFQRYRESE
ncbi:hypothetical protein RJ639_031290 [Escallonia herrerae]|uniref:Uncharacterized protein n=1 Tax=Escallonia herrerae TaxID=1293975 RepID=A0AA89BHM6_9ASTE|nr:hypothetical protein RJ639_031290 [Escallonia herrerae]